MGLLGGGWYGLEETTVVSMTLLSNTPEMEIGVEPAHSGLSED